MQNNEKLTKRPNKHRIDICNNKNMTIGLIKSYYLQGKIRLSYTCIMVAWSGMSAEHFCFPEPDL